MSENEKKERETYYNSKPRLGGNGPSKIRQQFNRGMTYFQICLYFLVYSFGGWVVEVIFHAVALGKVINRGFLNGPVCPVYGFGVLSVFALLNTIQSGGHQMSEGMIFVFGFVLATAVELIAGWLLDVCFHARWWDSFRDVRPCRPRQPLPQPRQSRISDNTDLLKIRGL